MRSPAKRPVQPPPPYLREGDAVRPLGTILREAGHIAPGRLCAALTAQVELRRPLGEILRRRGDISGDSLTEALGAQSGLLSVDLSRYPADPELSAGMDPRGLLRLGLLPWRRVGRRVICALSAPQDAAPLRAAIEARQPGLGDRLSFVLADRVALEDEIARLHRDRLSALTRDRCPEALSCRSWAGRRRGPVLPLVLFTALLLCLAAPSGMLALALAWIAAMTLATSALRGFALIHSFRRDADTGPFVADGVVPLPPPGGWPVVSILVPLYREEVTLPQLVAALGASRYPKELLDVILVTEEDDLATPLALSQIDLPPWIRVLRVPQDRLKTKPRAMNYALEFCRGSVVGIYDAEDRPEPDQIHRIASRLGRAAPDVACVQGYLDFYNARQNFLSRCFAIEYAIWFRVLLGGVQRLGLPIPLGGTTVFFRRSALEALGAWDAHNVTEDADLGFRLARFGYRTEMVATTTHEEANCRPLPWIHQRSRWLKGYAMTWVTHMRAPRALWRDLGPRGFFGFQLLLLGGLTAYLSVPLFWLLWLGWWGLALPVFELWPAAVWQGFFAVMAAGQAVMLSVAARAVWSRPRRHLLLTVPFLALYWPLGAVAAWRAVVEIFTRPFFWAKTEHGL